MVIETTQKAVNFFEAVRTSTGPEKGDLLELAGLTEHHIGQAAKILGTADLLVRNHGFSDSEAILYRYALADRGLLQIEKALKRIQMVAKERGYGEVLKIFEEEYHMGLLKTEDLMRARAH